MKKIRVIIHHSATPDGKTFSMNAMRRYHIEVNGWKDIGYHMICEAGADATGALHYEVILGRPLDADGAHCPQANSNVEAIGFCFVGNYDVAPPPPEMLLYGAKHLAGVMWSLGIPISRHAVKGHRELNPSKTCPGKMFDLDEFVRILKAA